MGSTEKIAVQVQDPRGVVVGTLTISLLGEAQPAEPPPLLDLRGDPDRDPSLEPLQLLEETEYRYSYVPEPGCDQEITLEPRELFSPDSRGGLSGRLRPRFYTGTLPISVLSGTSELGRVLFEVRSRKLDYLNQYRWMLEEIADHMADLIMERFAPTEQRFEVYGKADAATLYSRFALLKALFAGETFEAAILQILSYPHRAWVQETDLRRPGQPIPMSAGVARRLCRPGPRVPCSNLAIPTLPARLEVTRTEVTLDTPENRFVKFVLLTWLHFVTEVERALLQERESAPVQRGLREVRTVLERLHEILSADLFHDVGRLSYLPAGSQVLQKRSGYRDLYRAYLQFEAASLLTWDGGEDVYGAGQRDVATLYEYWVFFQLVKVLQRLCQKDFDVAELFAVRPDGMGVSLRRGRARCLRGSITRLGRRLDLELWFNRTFGHRTGNRASWSRPMRPDYSILIKPGPIYGSADEVWIHFDAKYRVETITNLFGEDPTTEEDEAAFLAEEQTADAKSVSKRADLLKMHAYRDAIRRSAGAYVIYPGTEHERLQQYHELLPGLGAFALRPARDGKGTGVDALAEFIDAVITHVATQTTQHERARFWVNEATRSGSNVRPQPAASFLTKPPADTVVLLGYVKGQEHLRWIHEHHLYNLRADRSRRGVVLPDSMELAAELVVLYAPSLRVVEVWRVGGPLMLMTKADMDALGYPDPKGSYFCRRLYEIPRELWPPTLSVERILAVRQRVKPGISPGAPVATTWLELLKE